MSSQAPCTEASPDLIVYGGAFDPPHSGHLDVLQAVMRRFPNARVLIVPSDVPAIAGSPNGKQVAASFDDRVAMVRTLTDKLGSERVSVITLERDLPKPNYSLRTLQSIATRHPDRRLAFLFGQDQLESFVRWYEPRAILDLADLIVAPRSGSQATSDLVGAINSVLTQLNLGLQWDGNTLMAKIQRSGKNIYLLTDSLSPANSTEIRKCIAEGTKAPSDWLPPEVDAYINTHHLYRHTEV